MARLLIKSKDFQERALELRLGVNRFGRGQGNDFQIEHPTISSRHCEIELSNQGIVVRDCNSTNGTYVDSQRVAEISLSEGQVLRLGEVELLVESVEVTVAIPKFEVPSPTSPPIVLTDGSLVCPRHPHALVTHQCTHCREVMCDECVHRLRRRGGKLYKLCPICSHNCEPLGAGRKRKKSLLGFLRRTAKLPFLKNKKPQE